MSPPYCCLGIDPGLGRTGYAYCLDKCVAEWGVITTPTGASLASRLDTLHRDLLTLLRQNPSPTRVVVERFVAGPKLPVSTAANVLHARGVILLALHREGLTDLVIEPTAGQIKKAVTSDGRATKAKVRSFVKEYFHLHGATGLDDSFDALAAAML